MTASIPTAPRVETERLVLRAHSADDLADLRETWSDPQVNRYIGGRPCTEEEAWQRLLRYAGHWPLLGYGFWRVSDRESDRYLGDIGFFQGRRDLGPAFDAAPEVGWTLAAHAHGRGLATEALAAVLAWGDARLPHGRTVCMIHPENAPSFAVAARQGYSEFTRATFKEAPVVLLERRRPAGAR